MCWRRASELLVVFVGVPFLCLFFFFGVGFYLFIYCNKIVDGCKAKANAFLKNCLYLS